MTWELYHYTPSLAAAAAFCGLFTLTMFIHFYQFIRTRTWYLIPLLIGGIFEQMGYIGRAISSTESPDWSLGPYIMQSLLLLVAPALFAATIYMELGYIILLVDAEKHSLVRKQWLTKIFVAGDVIAFFTQGAGGGIMAGKKESSMKLGSHIILGGLFLQILFFGLFMLVALIFDRRVRRNPTSQSLDPNVPWRKHLIVLFAASGLIMIRSIFRVVEYVQGNDGYLLRHEYYLYVFDAVLMLGVMLLFNVVHPSEVKALLVGGKAARRVIKLETIRPLPKNDDGSSETGLRQTMR